MSPPPSSDFLVVPARRIALGRLREEIGHRLRRERGGRNEAWRVERAEVEVEPCDLLAWLEVQPHADKLYWHGRNEEAATGAVGSADVVSGEVEPTLSLLEERARQLPEAGRYFGGLRFETGRPSAPEWQPFGAARFVLPRIEYAVRGERATLSVNLVLPRDAQHPEAVFEALDRVRWPAATPPGDLPLPVGRADVPQREGWQQGIKRALRAFRTTSLEKVVLARRARYVFDEPLDPFGLTQSLEWATPSCFHFLVQPELGVTFLGASPERLFRREGRTLLSEAVAGTRPRGASSAADARLREELQMSDKDQREHGYVREQIRASLAPFCESLDVDAEASDMRLARGRHLYSGITASLKPDVRTLDLLRALHPTPAVGGTPTPEALAMIADVEPFDRGWYAGPIGWVGRGAAEFAVGIRSGLVQLGDESATLSLYSGAGIVRGSSPEAEWDEIEHKISDFARVLALDA